MEHLGCALAAVEGKKDVIVHGSVDGSIVAKRLIVVTGSIESSASDYFDPVTVSIACIFSETS